jgi:hypothetical protein
LGVLLQLDFLEPREGILVEEAPEQPDEPYELSAAPPVGATKTRFTWRIENFSTFCEILQTRKIFSK